MVDVLTRRPVQGRARLAHTRGTRAPEVTAASASPGRVSFDAAIVIALVVVVFFGGFLNLVPTGPYFLSTLLADALLALCVVRYCTIALVRRGRVRVEWWQAAWGVALVVAIALVPNGAEPLMTELLAIRSMLVYAFVGVFAARALDRPGDADRVLGAFCVLATASAAFGVFQYLFRHSLPEMLLVSRDAPAFGYIGTDIIRATGLVGNTIIYGNLMVLSFAVVFNRMLRHHQVRTVVASACMAAAVVCTFSRMALLGVVAVTVGSLVVYALQQGRGAVVLRWTVTASVLLLIGALAVVQAGALPRISSSFLVSGLIRGENASVRGSTQGHFDFFRHAADALEQSPWAGIGLGTQRLDSQQAAMYEVVTDGALMIVLIEGGLLLFAAYSALLGATVVGLVRARVDEPRQYLASGLVVFAVFEFGIASVFNSAYLGKSSFLAFWLLVGVVFAQTRPDRPAPPTGPASRRLATSPGGRATREAGR